MLVTRGGLAALCTALVLASCSDDSATGPRFDPDVPGILLRMRGDSVFLGRTVQLDAVATGPDSAAVAWPEFTWQSSDTLVTVVDGAGLARGVGTGSATVTVEYAGFTATRTVRVVLARADGGTSFASLSKGAGGHCALTEDGVAYCRAIAEGDSIARYAMLPGADGVALDELHVALPHSCGRTRAMTVYCWGSNAFGQFLNGHRLAPPETGAPGAVNGTLTIAGLTVGSQGPGTTIRGRSCIIVASDNSVQCAGDGSSGALGRVTTAEQPDSILAPVAGNFRARAISAGVGGDFVCAVATTPGAYCWGLNSFGATGIGTGPDPRLITGSGSFTTVSSGATHVCALADAGAAYCWGRNSFGQLGNGREDSFSHGTPQLVPGAQPFVAIAVAANYSCGVTVNDELYCWGAIPPSGFAARLGARRATPVRIAPEFRFRAVTTDNASVCGLTTDGRVYCF